MRVKILRCCEGKPLGGQHPGGEHCYGGQLAFEEWRKSQKAHQFVWHIHNLHVKPGQVYRRADLAQWSNAVDRQLKQRVKEGTLQKVSQGVYACLKKHHGKFKQGNRTFNFQMKPYFPKEVSKEFLLVNLVNNVNKLAEAQDVMLERVSRLAANMDSSPLKKDTLLERISLILSKL